MTELLKQPQYAPLPFEEQVVTIWAGTNGHLDSIPVAEIAGFAAGFLDYIKTHERKLLAALKAEKKLSSEAEQQLVTAITSFKEERSPETNNEAAS